MSSGAQVPKQRPLYSDKQALREGSYRSQITAINHLKECIPCKPEQLFVRGLITFQEAIARIINSGLLEGHDQKVIGGMGDAAAVIVTKVVGGRQLSNQQVDSILIILNSAFGGLDHSSGIQPRTTLFVLRYLEVTNQDVDLRQRIEQTRKYVQTLTASTAKAPGSN
jgi:hypothetical protein